MCKRWDTPQNPVCMMVGLLSKEPGVLPTQSQRYGIRIVEPVLDALQIEHHLIEAPVTTLRRLSRPLKRPMLVPCQSSC
jgi:hypothetical protein